MGRFFILPSRQLILQTRQLLSRFVHLKILLPARSAFRRETGQWVSLVSMESFKYSLKENNNNNEYTVMSQLLLKENRVARRVVYER